MVTLGEPRMVCSYVNSKIILKNHYIKEGKNGFEWKKNIYCNIKCSQVYVILLKHQEN